jgi:hypothetical protein
MLPWLGTVVSNKSYSREILEQLSMVFQYVEKNYTHPIKLADERCRC